MSTDDKTKNWYNENASKYTAHVRDESDSIYHAYYEKPAMYSLLPNLEGKKVLSLGCGSGEDSNYLKQQGASESVGIDISEKLILIAQESYPACQFEVMDMEKLRYPDNSFDFVYSSLAIHYIEDWTTVFKGVYRVLKPDSYFLFSCGHPIRSAMTITVDNDDLQIRQLSIIKHKSPKSIEIIGNYMDHRKLSDGLGNLADVTTWHKSISEIVNEAKIAGFLIETFLEPRPLEGLKNISDRDYIRLNKIPEFMIFRMVKLKDKKFSNHDGHHRVFKTFH